MDRNSVIGIVIIAAILIGASIYNRPSAEQVAKVRREKDSVEAVQAAAKAVLQKATSLAKNNPEKNVADTAQFGSFAHAVIGTEQFVNLENDLIKVTLSNKGGRVYSVELKQYKRWDGKPLMLFQGDSSQMGLRFFANNRAFNTEELYFSPVTGNGNNATAMRLYAGNDKQYVEYAYSLAPGSYSLDFKVNMVGMNNVIAANVTSLDLNWQAALHKQEKDVTIERQSATVYYKYTTEEVDNLKPTKDDRLAFTNKVKWVGFKQQYFTAVLIADNNFENPSSVETRTDAGSNEIVKLYKANLVLPYNHTPSESFGMQWYFGPNQYKTLKSYNLDMEKQISLGWGIFGWINKGIVIQVFNWLKDFGLNFGLIIFILTIILKLMLTPLTYTSYKSQIKMKVLKPEMDEIDAKYGKDPVKSQQEKMSLFKKAGVNPLGGCLPLLLQMPILIALVSFFPASIELRQQSFLWAKDLSTYDSVLDFGFNIPFYGGHLGLFALLMTISTLVMSWQNSQIATAQNPQMKWMMYLMPIMFLGFLNSRPAALSYYYLVANIITMLQQFLMRKFIDEKALHAAIQENKKKPVKKSSFQQKLEEMAKQKGYTPKK